jgi:hypothetical protein
LYQSSRYRWKRKDNPFFSPSFRVFNEFRVNSINTSSFFTFICHQSRVQFIQWIVCKKFRFEGHFSTSLSNKHGFDSSEPWRLAECYIVVCYLMSGRSSRAGNGTKFTKQNPGFLARVDAVCAFYCLFPFFFFVVCSALTINDSQWLKLCFATA